MNDVVRILRRILADLAGDIATEDDLIQQIVQAFEEAEWYDRSTAERLCSRAFNEGYQKARAKFEVIE